MEGAPPEFWAFAIPPGGTLSQAVPKTACVCLTSAVLSAPSSERVVLTATCGSSSAVLCNLFGSNGHDAAKLGQPFHQDFELSVSGGSATIHVSGFARGELGIAEIKEDERKRNQRIDSAAPSKNKTGAGSKAAAAAAAAADDDDDDDDDESEEGEEEEGEEEDDFEGSEDEEEGEEEDDDDEDDDDDEEDEDEEADMPLAPKSVEDLLKGLGAGKKRPAAEPTGGTAKAAKTAPAPAPAKPAPAKPAPAAADKATFGEKAAAKPAGPVRLPSGVEVTDVSVGNGPLCQRGKRVNVKYYGTLVNGKKFDAGTIAFRLGGGEVIPGWDQGIQGMRVGGKRKLKIPPAQAYGKRGAPPTIPGNSTLLFDVQLLSC